MFSYLKSRFDPIVEKVKTSPTTGYVKEKVSMANTKVRTFIDQRVRGRVEDGRVEDVESSKLSPKY